MRKLFILIAVATVMISAVACSSLNLVRPKASPTPPPVLSTLPHKAASPTPTLAGRIMPSTPTERPVVPTLSPEQLTTCLNALPTDMPDTVKQMTSGSSQGAHPLVACDNFVDNSNGWSLGNWNGNYVQGVESIKDGVMGWQGVSTDGGVWYDFPQSSPSISDFTLTISTRILKSPSTAQIGIFYRYDGDNFYMASISTNMYQFYLFDNGQWEKLTDPQPFPASFDDTSKPGWITLEVKGDTHTLYFNNEHVDSIQDNTLTTGTVGLGVDLDASLDQASVEFYHFILRGE